MPSPFSIPFRELATLGRGFDPQVMMATRKMFAEPVAAQSWGRALLEENIRYGTAERHRMDIARAARPGAPVLLFVHGGGFVAGDKNSDGLFYANVPRYFADNGFMGVAMNYRFPPEAGWPAGAEDIAAALAWIAEHASTHGGDPNNIVLLGQSAGASHLATYLFDPAFSAKRPAGLRAAALMSGYYIASAPLSGGPALYFGDDESLYAQRSPATHVAAGHPPVLLTIAEYDPGEIAAHTLSLAQALLAADGAMSPLIWLAGHNHVSPVHALGLDGDVVGPALLAHFRGALNA